MTLTLHQENVKHSYDLLRADITWKIFMSFIICSMLWHFIRPEKWLSLTPVKTDYWWWWFDCSFVTTAIIIFCCSRTQNGLPSSYWLYQVVLGVAVKMCVVVDNPYLKAGSNRSYSFIEFSSLKPVGGGTEDSASVILVQKQCSRRIWEWTLEQM